MNFLLTIRNSIYSPSFYATIPQKSFGSALGYFLLLSLFLTIIQSISPVWGFLTVGQKEVETFVNQIEEAYPSELEVKIQNGKVSTNVQEPYFISLPQDKNRTTEDTTANLVVIDTKTPFSITQFNQYKAIAWVTKDSVFLKSDNNGQIRTIDLSKVSDMSIDKAFVVSLFEKFSPWLKLITPLAILGILLGVYLLHTGRLVYLLFLAIVIWVLAKLLKRPLTYSGSYKVGLYAITLGFLIELLSDFVHFSGFPFMFTLITLIVVSVNFLPTRSKSATLLS